MLTMLLYAMYTYIANLVATVSQTWQLQDVQTGYLYINGINALYALAILFTSPIWSRFMQKKGTFLTLALGCFLLGPTHFAYAFVTTENFRWLMTAVRLVQHAISMLLHFSVSNLLYINLPKADRTNYISFHTVLGNLAVFASLGTATWVVAMMGDSVWYLFGHPMSSVPTLLLVQFVLFMLLGVLTLLLRKKAEPEGIKI